MLRDTLVCKTEIPGTDEMSEAMEVVEDISYGRVIVAGAGFFADAYDLFVINMVVDMMELENYDEVLTTELKSNVKSTALIGAVVGQLFFGATADLMGRRKVFIATAALIILGALMSATVVDSKSFGIYSQLCLWRFVLGVGVGGEYPLSASITSEASSEKDKIKNLAAVFSMQGWGTVFCALVLVIVTHTLGDNYNAMWRISLGIGGLPMVIAFYFRWNMHESKAWEKKDEEILRENGPNVSTFTSRNPMPNTNEALSESSDEQALRLKVSSPRNHEEMTCLAYFVYGTKHTWGVVMENKWRLLGTAGAWFILDVVFYANGLFSGQITSQLGFGENIRSEAVGELVLRSISLPGYFLSIMYATQIGVRNLQMIGFAAVAFFFFLLGGLNPVLSAEPAAYLIMYGITFLFQNFGANATTYIIPSILYPTKHKATCHGISAAAGKIGAIVGAEVLLYIDYAYCSNDQCDDASPEADVSRGLSAVFYVCAALSIIGLAWTYYLVEERIGDIFPVPIGYEGTAKTDKSLPYAPAAVSQETVVNVIGNDQL
jgi:PHS family inorganic phosphate transporter-like MFS transporter